jgi:hypothetical protein
MKVKISEIESVLTLLLTNLKEKVGNEITIDSDYYWENSPDEVYDPYKKPKDFTLGQLSDDMQELRRLTSSEDTITYDLNRISRILKAISIENPI